MNPRLWWALGAFALALMLLAPSLAPLPSSMDQFAGELANGTFRPFGNAPGKTGATGGGLGGLTGVSSGNFVAGATAIPDTWNMDRDASGGSVVVDYVFNPSPGAMKRLKAYDRVGPDGASLEVADKRLHPITPSAGLAYDLPVAGSFPVQLKKGEPVPIFSVAPKGFVTSSWSTDPPLSGGLTFLQDGADTFYVLANEDKRVTLNLTFLVNTDYFSFQPSGAARTSDYRAGLVGALPAGLSESAKIVMARAGVKDPTQVASTLEALNVYFRSFTDGPVPAPDEVENLYLALALGGHGCCRHRAFAYMVTAQAAGIPTRVIVNEAHAFPEVMFPDGHWHQVNLGGCGSYSINNPNNYPSLFEQAQNPRTEANPDEGRPQVAVVTFTNITDAPPRMVKGEHYFVNGTVEASNGRPVAGAPIDLFLNATKTSRGKLMTSGQTDATGTFSIEARVPIDVPAQGYQLVASAGSVSAGPLKYDISWSDPPVDVFSPTRLVVPKVTAAAGFPANATGRLVDVDGNPVGPATVRWNVEGVPQSDLRADAAGLFSGRFQFNDTGNKTLDFLYDGDAHHGATRATVGVTVDHGTILVPAEPPVLLRGSDAALSGDVAIAGATLSGQTVGATAQLSDGSGPVTTLVPGVTDARGHFTARWRVPASAAPGVYNVRYTAPSLGLATVGLARVAIKPVFSVESPEAVGREETWIATARVLSDNGTALSGALVELTFDGNASTTRQLLTNSTGFARFEIVGGVLPVGTHAARLSFAGDRIHAATDASVSVRVLPPFYQLVPLAVWEGLAALALLVAAALWLLRPAGRVRRVLAKPPWRVELSFPEFPEGVAPVGEPGGAIEVRARVLDKQGMPMPARLLLISPAGRQRGRDVFAVPTPMEGVLSFEVRPRGLARWLAAPARVALPVASYRRAVEDGFVALRARARLAQSATPQDLEEALAPHLAPHERARLHEAARLFERADYSEAPVDRDDYHLFATARRDVERALESGSFG